MENDVKKIISNLSDLILQIDPDQKPNKIVKNIDRIVNKAYSDLYLTLDDRKRWHIENKGHCN